MLWPLDFTTHYLTSPNSFRQDSPFPHSYWYWQFIFKGPYNNIWDTKLNFLLLCFGWQRPYLKTKLGRPTFFSLWFHAMKKLVYDRVMGTALQPGGCVPSWPTFLGTSCPWKEWSEAKVGRGNFQPRKSREVSTPVSIETSNRRCPNSRKGKIPKEGVEVEPGERGVVRWTI